MGNADVRPRRLIGSMMLGRLGVFVKSSSGGARCAAFERLILEGLDVLVESGGGWEGDVSMLSVGFLLWLVEAVGQL